MITTPVHSQRYRLIQIKFFSTKLSNIAILATDFKGLEQMSALSWYSLKLASVDYISLKDLLNQPVLVILYQYSQKRYIHGFIVTCQYLFSSKQTVHHYQVLLHTTLWLLAQQKNSRMFHQQNIEEICQNVLEKHDINPYQFNFFKLHRSHTHQTQYNESELQFLSRLFNTEGIFYYFKPSNNTNLLILSDSIEGYADNGHHMRVEYGRYHGFHLYHCKSIVTSFNDKAQRNDKIYSSSAVQMIAKSNQHTFYPGCVFSLTHQGMRQKYLIIKIRHHALDYSSTTLMTQNNPYYYNTLHCIPLLKSYPIGSNIQLKKIPGVQTATVLNSSHSTSLAHNSKGQIRVLFPWDLLKTGSSLIPIKQPIADSSFGVQFFPHVGDEVLVTFEQGNPNQPILIGSLYHRKEALPFKLNTSGIKTLLNHELSFCDALNRETITLRSNHDLHTMVKGDMSIQAQKNHSTHIQDGNQSILTKSQYHMSAKDYILLKTNNGSIKITPHQIILTGGLIELN